MGNTRRRCRSISPPLKKKKTKIMDEPRIDPNRKVIYLAIQDFLQKREREKFEKEEADKKKKGGKKAKIKARTGPRGFGQKNEEDDD